MNMVSRRLFDGICNRIGLSRSSVEAPGLILALGDDVRDGEAVHDRIQGLLHDQFAIAATIDAKAQDDNSDDLENFTPSKNRTLTSGPIWKGTILLEEGVGDLFVALQAGPTPDEPVIHVRPALDYNQSTPFPFERCASFEVSPATIDKYEHCIATLLLAMSPVGMSSVGHAASKRDDTALTERISQISSNLNARIKTSLAQADVGEQLMTWHAYAACLHWLGTHDNRLDLLVEATRYYHVSLDPLARRTTPLLWATVQNNLGVALCNIDRLVPSSHRLQLAVEAFHNGLDATSGHHAPLLVSALYVNLGHANLKLYQNSNDREHIELAIDAFENALRHQPKDQAPARWASIFDGLGTALREHGSARNAPNELIQAIQAYHSAMDMRGQDETSTASTVTSVNLGQALCRLGALQASSYRLFEGIEILQRAAQEIDRESQLHLWVEAQEAIGSALLIVGRRERKVDYLCGAIAALIAALGGLDSIDQLAKWSVAQVKLGRAYHLLGKLLGANDSGSDREAATRCLQHAEQACRSAGAAYETLGADEQAERMNAQIEKIRRTHDWIQQKDETTPTEPA